jgi:putative peptide maturation system protein
MTADRIDPLVADAIALLARLRCEATPPDAAWPDVVRLRERHPGRSIQLIWERESYLDRVHYDLLIELDAGTLSVSYCADDDVPWLSRGLQRLDESVVVRVNDEPLEIVQAITSLDYAWQHLHVGRHLIHMSLIEQEIRNRRIEVSDRQLAAALAAFRVGRRLFTAAAVERWMAEHGASQAQLEQHLRHDAALDELRRQVIGGPAAIAAWFTAHRAELDRVQVARISVAARETADALHRELRDQPHQFLVAAQRHFLQGGSPGDVFLTLRRGALDADHAAALFDTEPGELAPVLASGDGFDVVQVLRRLPAVLDDETRTAIGELRFAAWLDEQRARARVEWFWGAADAAEVPAIAL